MLQFNGDGEAKFCDGLTRRDFLRAGVLSAGAVGLSLADLARAGTNPSRDVNCIVLFLVALGVDYTIVLVTRAREETPPHGTRQGIIRAVSATGAVITSAGIVLAAVFCVLGVLPLIALTRPVSNA